MGKKQKVITLDRDFNAMIQANSDAAWEAMREIRESADADEYQEEEESEEKSTE